jgi:hypothetical protein
MNDEWEETWKETLVAYSRYYPGIYLEGRRQITKTLNRDSRCSGRDSYPAPPEYKSRLLSLYQPILFFVSVPKEHMIAHLNLRITVNFTNIQQERYLRAVLRN